jgi:SAM-dependent MidA family methyltransferase
MRFIDTFQEQLQNRPAMPFVEFMHHALYAPHVGYYSTGTSLFGPRGDFITAPELTPLFGYTLANQCQSIFNHLDHPILFEFGAGSGRLCVDLLTALKQLDALPDEYHILDVSASLKSQQQTLIQQEIPELADRVRWLSRWPSEPFEGVMIANEVLDAMPVHRFLRTEHGLQESMVQLTPEGLFNEQFMPSTNPYLSAHVQRVLTHAVVPYLSEVNLFIDDWLLQCHDVLAKGALLIIDYGFPQHEYYHPDRSQGTLMCHAKHRAHANPCHNPGAEDITAHVDFTHVAEAAYDAGFHVAGYTNQASFLLANDLLNCLEAVPDGTLRFAAQQAVKILTQPSEMGELFKVMALTKHLDFPLTGFQLNDKRASL